MKVVSFNTNSIRSRLHQLQAVIDKHHPDVIGIQETKVSDEEFPVTDIEALGYHAAFHGQKTHYGVALLTRQAPSHVAKGFPSDEPDAQKRLIIADITTDSGNKVSIINGYFPQGESRDHPVKFPNKRHFYRDLMALLNDAYEPDHLLLIMGDFNISPEDKDIGIGADNAKRWLRTGKCSFLPEEREWFQSLLEWGLNDTFRLCHPDIDDQFSWFDYRSKGFDREPKRGLRIDGILATAPMTQTLTAAGIDYDIRAMEKPSDHAPVWAEFNV
ncbi:exodeoxyribonuclease III [Kistimonas asteriae]|uniref:exodeoxyribonuclease III n=1 Tax=Kistimonas asteriae TaxID=517724 RepID=UPI001BA5909D|nr:exodeoxyribonuclease III [Kistimonas asteriae]